MSDVLQSLLLIVASIAALLVLARFVPHTARPSEAKGGEHPVSGRSATAPSMAPPSTPQKTVLVPVASTPLFRRGRVSRVTVADARTGIVLAAILGPCRAHASDDDLIH
jgi:hypothetical protein